MSFKHAVASAFFPIVNYLLSPLNLKLLRRGTPNRDFAEFISHLKDLEFNIKTVIDVGVAFGSPAFYKTLPQAKFYLVEPVPQCKPVLEKLEKRLDADCFSVAAGAEDGEMTFFVHSDVSGSSSLRQWEGEYFDGEKLSVPVRRLDSLVPRSIARPCLLKIDTQGNELDVIEGAKGILDLVDVVIIETSFHEFRKGAPEIHEIIGRMMELDYRCYEILEGHYRAADNALAQVDVAFVKNDSVLRATKSYFLQDQAREYLSQSGPRAL